MIVGDLAEPRLRSIEPNAIGAIWSREIQLFRRYWRPTTFSAVVEPTIYFLALGLGLGALITEVDGIPYVQFVGTGIVASAAMSAAVFPGMFNTFVARVFQKVYDGILATPISPGELVLGEATWISAKAGIYACAPLLITIIFFDLPPVPSMVLVPLVAVLTALGWAFFGQWMSGIVSTIDSFSYVTGALITPLFLVSGIFFPLGNLPDWARLVAELNPLYHSVQLVRDASFADLAVNDLGHLIFLVGFALVAGFLAVRRLTVRLID
jgi:lipooligosaccharide transport system permease protein